MINTSQPLQRLLLCVTLVHYLALPLVAADAADPPAHDSDSPRQSARGLFRSLAYARTLVKDADSGAFVDISFNELSPNMVQRMNFRMANLFSERAHPHSQRDGKLPIDDLRVRVHAANDRSEDDLIEYRWPFRGLELRVVSSANALRLQIDLNQVAKDQDLDEYGYEEMDRVKGLVTSLVRLKGTTYTLDRVAYELKIPWPRALTDGVTFCSNAAQDLRGMDNYFWFKRVDGFVDGRILSLQFYTKPGQRMTYMDGSKWFSDAFRSLIKRESNQ